MTRLQKILAGLLVVQIILAIVVFWPRQTNIVEAKPLVETLTADAISTLTIEDGNGQRAALVKVDGSWQVADSDGFAADASKITPLLTKLLAIKSGHLIAKNEASQARLQVASNKYNRKVTLTQDAEKVVLYIGSQASGNATHVRAATSNDIFLTSEIKPYELNTALNNWIDTKYVTVTQSAIQKMTLENAQGTFHFSLDEEGQWTWDELPEGEQLDQTKVTALASRFASARIDKPLGKTDKADYGFAQPLATLQVELDDGTQQQFLIGAETADNKYYAKYSESDYYVTVSNFTGNILVENSAEDFIVSAEE